METGAGNAVALPDGAFKDIVFVDDRKALVAVADVVLCVQPPSRSG